MVVCLVQTPEAAEQAEEIRIKQAASTIQRWWRRCRWRMAVELQCAEMAAGQDPSRTKDWMYAHLNILNYPGAVFIQ